MSPIANLLSSELFEIKETTESGRGVYACQQITQGALLFETADLASCVIYREYRKEVCAQCFSYDRGRQWKIRDTETGFVFCSQECKQHWVVSNHGLRAQAYAAIEAVGKGNRLPEPELDDESSWSEHRPSVEEISTAWERVEEIAVQIRAARLSERPSKSQRRALNEAMAVSPQRDTLLTLLSCTLCAATEPDVWAAVLDLVGDQTPYQYPTILDYHIASYRHLLSSCPLELLPHIRADVLRTFAERSAHNVFNIWSQELGADDADKHDAGAVQAGSECLGMALWPAASFWNHSCGPNVRKQRDGRTWKFWAARDINDGEELCISYLGGDERDMGLEERQMKLEGLWGFQCACTRCVQQLD